MVNTDENCSIRMLTLARLSVNNSLHFSRDGMPLCSFLLDLMYDQNFLEPQPLFMSKSLETYVTGSAKKGHNRTSQNLQYKALNTLGEILAYY